MRTDVLQAAALCFHGNAYLADPESVPAPELHPSNNAFRNVYELAFERRGASPADKVPECTSAWFKRLQADGVDHLTLSLEKCALDSNRHPDEKWGVVADGERGCEIWQPAVRARSRDKNDFTPFLVIYHGERFNRWALKPLPTRSEAFENLGVALKTFREFCCRRRLDALLSPLDRCLTLQGEADQSLGGFSDICPPGLPSDAMALLAAALRPFMLLNSSVWNLQSATPEDKLEFADAAGKLWRGVGLALEVAATNGLKREALPKSPESPDQRVA